MSNDVTDVNTVKSSPVRPVVLAGIVTAVLLIPLLTNAPWTAGDYLFAGVVLAFCAAVFEIAARKTSNLGHRVAIAAIIVFFIVLVVGWAASGP